MLATSSRRIILRLEARKATKACLSTSSFGSLLSWRDNTKVNYDSLLKNLLQINIKQSNDSFYLKISIFFSLW